MTDANFYLTRLVFQRALAFVYLIGFVVALNQFRPLLGDHGLLPVRDFVKQVSFRQSPSLFFFAPHDTAFVVVAWIGIALSFVALVGLAERAPVWLYASIWTMMWLLYMSFVNVGQMFYGFGWESLLLEAGFYTIFLGPAHVAPPKLTIWMLRWLTFRIMFGAGMIKMRGDACWKDLTCLDYHYETQPMPNPISWFLHVAPVWTQRAGVLFNHFAELIVPFGYFAPNPISGIAGLLTMLFQGSIFVSGNLSWLNFLTIVLAIPTMDDRFFGFLARFKPIAIPPADPILTGAVWLVTALVALLSINPILNMLSPGQLMNASFNPLHLVGTYGAFGSVTRERYEIVVEGTGDAAITPATEWHEYEFKGKPNDPKRLPPQVAPYHLRLDWLMWFAAMSDYSQHPWFVHFIEKLLVNDRAVLSLLRKNPFPHDPPRFVRAQLYEYHFTTPAERRSTGAWWTRRLAGPYFPAVSLQSPSFRYLLDRLGWLEAPAS